LDLNNSEETKENMVIEHGNSNQMESALNNDKATMKQLLKGGARGITKITLSECKEISDKGVKALGKLRNLKYLSLLGCHNVGDKGVCRILSKCSNLIDLDVGGTNITMKTIQYIISYCPNLRVVRLKGCKRLNINHIMLLEEQGTYVDSGDDICRFYMLPEREGEFVKITDNILKTRSSLSVYKLYRFLQEKLGKADKNLTYEELENLQITCNKSVVPMNYTVEDIKGMSPKTDTLILHYRKKLIIKTISPFETFQQNIRKIKEPQLLIDSSEIQCCMNLKCSQRFGFFTKKHHCLHCGKCYCGECTKYERELPELSYDDPVKVCFLCWCFLRGKS